MLFGDSGMVIACTGAGIADDAVSFGACLIGELAIFPIVAVMGKLGGGQAADLGIGADDLHTVDGSDALFGVHDLIEQVGVVGVAGATLGVTTGVVELEFGVQEQVVLVLAAQRDIFADDGFGIALELVVEQVIRNQIGAVVCHQGSLAADCAQPGAVAVLKGEGVGVQPDVAGGVAEQALAVAHHAHVGAVEYGVEGLHVDAGIAVVQDVQAAAFHVEADAGPTMGLIAVDIDIGILDVPVSGIAGVAGIVFHDDLGVVDVDVHVVDRETATVVVAEVDGGVVDEDRIVEVAQVTGIEGVDVAATGLALHPRCGHSAVVQGKHGLSVHRIAPAACVSNGADVGVVEGDLAGTVQTQELAEESSAGDIAAIEGDVAVVQVDASVVTAAGEGSGALTGDEGAVLEDNVLADAQLGCGFAVVVGSGAGDALE